MSTSPRRGMTAVALLVVLALVAVACGNANTTTTTTTTTEPPATDSILLTTARSLVEHLAAGGTVTEVVLQATRPIGVDDSVRLGNQGEALLEFSRFVVLRLFHDTQIQVRGEFNADEPGAEMRVRHGTLVADVLTPEQAEQLVQVDIETAAATIVALGTKFFVHVDPETQTTWVIVNEGAVEVTGAGETVIVNAGMQTWVEVGEAPVEPVPANRTEVGERFPAIEDLTNSGEGDIDWLGEKPQDTGGPVIDGFTVEPRTVGPDQQIAISVTASDTESAVAGIEIRIDGDTAAACTENVCSTTVGPLPPGSHSVSVIASDTSGNQTEQDATIVVDAEAPTIETTTLDPAVPHSAQSFDISVEANDPSGVDLIEISVDGNLLERCAAATCVATAGPLSPGSHAIEIAAVDTLGNQDAGSMEIEVVEALPDLSVESFELRGPAVSSPSGGLMVPFRLVIRNGGTVAAGPFGFSVGDRFARSFLIGRSFDFYPTVDGLGPGATIEVSGNIGTWSDPDGPSELIVALDSCAGVEFAPPECQVLEIDEDNNASAPRSVDFPPVAVISSPDVTDGLSCTVDGSCEASLDGTNSFDPDGNSVTYRWTVTDPVSGEQVDVGVEGAAETNFDLGPIGCGGTRTYQFALVVTDGSGNPTTAFSVIPYTRLC